MVIGSIDAGSNTVLLLVAEVKNGNLFPLRNEYRSPRLGKALKQGGRILEDRIKHFMTILDEYKNICKSYGCDTIIVNSTNAMRIASNSAEIIKRVKNELDLKINVISGDEEARLSYLGASSSFGHFEEKIVIDIGGGSTEIIYGNNSEIFFKKSFPVGVVSLTESFLNEFPYSNEALISAQKYLDEIFAEIKDKIPGRIPIIAVAGTPTTLSCIKQKIKIYDDAKVEGSSLSNEDLKGLYLQLVSMPGNAVKERFGQVVEGREDVLFSGLLILDHLRNLLLNELIYVSSRGLRYGNIYDYMNNLK